MPGKDLARFSTAGMAPVDQPSVVDRLILAFVFLRGAFTLKSFVGCLLIGAGTLMMVLQSCREMEA